MNNRLEDEPFPGYPPPYPPEHQTAFGNCDHSELFRTVFAPFDKTCAKIIARPECPDVWQIILESMKSTHESMHALLKAAIEFEEQKELLTHRYMDACYLARPQWEAVIMSLLFAHDPDKYIPWYYKSGWASRVAEVEYNSLRLMDLDEREAWIRQSHEWLKYQADLLEVSPEEYDYVRCIAQRKKYLGSLQKEQRSLFSPLPTPGRIYEGRLLVNSPHSRLSDYLYFQWKFACDSMHLGHNAIITRHAISGKGGVVFSKELLDRGFALNEKIYRYSLMPSFAAVVTMMTLAATVCLDEYEWCVGVSDAWDAVRNVYPEGASIWDIWAKNQLRIL